MKVFIDAVGIRNGGGATLLDTFLRCLPDRRPEWTWDVFTYAPELLEFELANLPETVSLHTGPASSSFLRRLRWVNHSVPRLAQKLDCDMILSFANLAPAKSGIPHIAYIHQIKAVDQDLLRELPFRSRVRFRIMRSLITGGVLAARRVVVQTDYMADCLRRLLPNDVTPIAVIPGVMRDGSNGLAVRQDFERCMASAGPLRFCYVSLPSEHKNHGRLLEAFAKVVNAFPKSRLILTVDSSDMVTTNGGRRVSVGQLARSLGVNQQVICAGLLNAAEVDHLYQNCDAMVFPSFAESCGLPMIEAMANQCPVAASDLPYAQEIASDTAVYFDPADPNDIARAMIQLVEDEVTRNQRVAAAAKRSRQYDPDAVAELLAQEIESACRTTSGGRTVSL